MDLERTLQLPGTSRAPTACLWQKQGLQAPQECFHKSCGAEPALCSAQHSRDCMTRSLSLSLTLCCVHRPPFSVRELSKPCLESGAGQQMLNECQSRLAARLNGRCGVDQPPHILHCGPTSAGCSLGWPLLRQSRHRAAERPQSFSRSAASPMKLVDLTILSLKSCQLLSSELSF